jgi:hypothetical protein
LIAKGTLWGSQQVGRGNGEGTGGQRKSKYVTCICIAIVLKAHQILLFKGKRGKGIKGI